MSKKIRFMHFVIVGALLSFSFFSTTDSVAMANTQGENQSAGAEDYISDIFAPDEPQEVEEEQTGSSPIIPAVLFLSLITMGTTGKHYHGYLQAQKQELTAMKDELNSKTAALVQVETGQVNALLDKVDAIEHQIASLDKDIYVKEALNETLK